MAEPLHLTISVRSHPHTVALKDGRVKVEGVDFEFVDVQPHIAAFRRMVRNVEFDVCELAPTTYYIAKAYGAPFTALPIFFERLFHPVGFVVQPDSDIHTPKDLEGKKVGVRAYSVTLGAWTRGILMNVFGVDSSKITWVVDDEEHVSQLVLPPNVEHVPEGKSLASMMQDGELDAAFSDNAGIGREGSPTGAWTEKATQPKVYRNLFPNADEIGADWYRREGVYPFHSTLVIKDSILEAHPEVARNIYKAFVEAKQIYLEELRSGKADDKADKRRLKQMEIVGPDPLPYGYAVNLPSMQALRKFALQQKLMPVDLTPEQLFINTDKF